MDLSVTGTTQTTGYDDIDNLNKAQNELYDKAYGEQQNIINTQTQQNVEEINRNKDKLNEETTKQNQGLYTDYMKQINPYGANAEVLVENGLGNSGASETSRVNLYNTYQKNRTNTLNTARSALAEYDAQIAKARQNGDIQLAQAALELYNQKIDNIYRNYQLMQNQKQFDYQVGRDQVADNQWQQQFDYNKSVNDRNYNYQLERDRVADDQWQKQYNTSNNQWQQEFDYNKATNDRNYNYQVGRDQVADSQWKQQFDYQANRDSVSDSQWQKEYELQKKNLASSASRGSSSKSTSANEFIVTDGNNEYIVADTGGTQNSTNQSQNNRALNNVLPAQPYSQQGFKNLVQDKKGTNFSSIDDLLAYRGYAMIE